MSQILAQMRRNTAKARRWLILLAGADLLGMPLLGDYLDETLSQFGHSTEEFEQSV
jgi:hypothetical protein